MIAAIAFRELRALFASPLAWVVLAMLQLILAWVFLGRLDAYLKAQAQLAQMPSPPGLTEIIAAPLFGTSAVILMMVVPLLTMRLVAEERRNRTLALLFSSPVTMTQIVLGKYFGVMGFLLLAVGLAALMPLTLLAGGTLDFGLLAANVLGLVLLTASFAALGLFMSCLTAHPALAGAAGFGCALMLWLLDTAAPDPASVLAALSLLRHYENFGKGLVDSFDLAYFVLFTTFF
ncbi:MAG TPA: ABC transporter permease subunit, partial [Burkholderiales bacterium]|nr:ABC transporter permease subunit [Burkholderiales bacterium]